MKVLIDTCVIVDYLENREGADAAERIFNDKALDRWISAKSIMDLFYLIHHFTHSNERTKEAIRRIIGIMSGIVDTTAEDVRKALASLTSDYEDAVMIETAVRIQADAIITDNVKDYKHSEVKVYTPNDFLKICGQKGEL